MPDAIGSEDEVKDRPDQVQEPDETHPCDGVARITLVADRMPGCQHREKQPKSDDSDVPDMPKMENGQHHYGLSRR
jgi:hypothetical protein